MQRKVVDSLLEMSNLSKDKTGLAYDIWIDSGGEVRKVSHRKPRLEVILNKNELVPVSISAEPEILVNKNIRKFREVAKWIKINRESLLKFWNKSIDHDELLKNLKSMNN